MVDSHEEDVAASLECNFLHKAVEPKHTNPFTSEQKEVFAGALAALHSSGIVPTGFGPDPSRWEDGMYPTAENIPIGKTGSKVLCVDVTTTSMEA